jgi:amicyanin
MERKKFWILACMVLSLSAIILISGCASSSAPPPKTGSGNQAAQPTLAQSSSSSSTPASPATVSVEIANFAFFPAEIKIKQGTTVIWTNKDSAPHTITSDSGSEISSPSLSNGGTYSHTFSQAGTFDYHCSIHLSMKGKVIVE